MADSSGFDPGALVRALNRLRDGDVTVRLPDVGQDDGGIARAFNEAAAMATAARHKSEFLANMSHELRTPLNSLLILARVLAENRDGNLTPRQLEFAGTIHDAGLDLLSLIDEILDLEKIESGTVALNIAQERFADMRDFVERNFAQVAIGKGLDFAITIDGALPASIATDARRLQQILKNLLANAFKFTPRGAVSLRIGFAPGPTGEGRVVAFTVADTGIGIEAARQPAVFEAFQQADGSTSREYGGTGLGLSISRGLARLLGGEIVLESAPGRGSAFTLLLPLDGACVPVGATATGRPPVAAPRAADPGIAARLAGRQVLIVDDDIRNVFALTSALEQHGMTVMHAESGKEAIDLLSRAPRLDALLMDVMMPGLDGYDTIRIVRRNDRWKRLPIVAVTAKAMLGDREKCLAAGANDYVAKPVDMDLLIGKIADSLEKAGAEA